MVLGIEGGRRIYCLQKAYKQLVRRSPFTTCKPRVVIDRDSDSHAILVDDVLLKTLCLCDISTVLIMSRVCKHFHSLVFSKEVWIALLSDLKARQFIDRMSYEEFRELSLEALVTLAKCITQGPSCPFPFALRRIHLHPLSDDESFALKDEAKLLPGGQYVLFTRDGRLRCWSVMEDRLVWEYQGQWESYQVREFAAEVVEDGRAATILLGICVAEPLLSTRRFVEIVHLDFLQEISRSICLHRAPDMVPDDDNAFSSPRICGDFAVIQLTQYIENDFLLLRLSTKSCCSFAMATLRSRDYRVELIPRHLILWENEICLYRLKFQIWRTDVLMEFIKRHYSHVGRRHPTPILFEHITLDMDTSRPGGSCRDFHLFAHASPLQEGLYTMWMLAKGSTINLIHKYHISILDPRQPTLRYKGSQICTLHTDPFDEQSIISFAGHIAQHSTYDVRWCCTITPLGQDLAIAPVKDVPRARGMRLRLNKGHRVSEIRHPVHDHLLHDNVSYDFVRCSVQLSAYSGVVTFCTRKQIRLNYYM